ncbi:hypothetical protein N9N20_07755 [Planktomarina temperata]|nr:hypothetical protein [Planktomarina temperata]
MNFRWLKRGKIFAPSGEFGWMNSHAQVPTVLNLGDKLRIYFSTRDQPGRSLIASMDVCSQNPQKIFCLEENPVTTLGLPGTFDEHGVMPSGIIFEKSTNKVILYYSGWSKRNSVPYSNLTGLLISEDIYQQPFERIGHGPILTTNLWEPYSATSPFILEDNGKYLAYYCSGTGWVNISGKYEHLYDIKVAHSDDGISWKQLSEVCVEQKNEHEALTRPTVIKILGEYHMWFCYRDSVDFRDGAGSYKLGYATSPDGINWTRNDSKSGISASDNGWDSTMMAYPYIIKNDFDQVFMFYNGNGFGKTGFGYAELEMNSSKGVD